MRHMSETTTNNKIILANLVKKVDKVFDYQNTISFGGSTLLQELFGEKFYEEFYREFYYAWFKELGDTISGLDVEEMIKKSILHASKVTGIDFTEYQETIPF